MKVRTHHHVSPFTAQCKTQNSTSFSSGWPPSGQAVADTGSLSYPWSIMSLPEWLKGRLNLDSPQREAVDNVRPFVTLCNERDIAVITLDDCWDVGWFLKLWGWPRDQRSWIYWTRNQKLGRHWYGVIYICTM